MRTALLAVLPALAALVLAGCGSQSAPPVGERGQTVVDARAEGSVDVRVRQVLDFSKARYTEGSYSYIRVERPDGKEVVEERVDEERDCSEFECVSKVFVRLDPGEYRLVSFQRPCEGNCGFLDPPMDRCARSIGVLAGEALNIVVTVRPGEGCKIQANRAGTRRSTAVSNEEALRLIRSCEVTEYLTLHSGETRLTLEDGRWVSVIGPDNHSLLRAGANAQSSGCEIALGME
jgi:hypothetical protein